MKQLFPVCLERDMFPVSECRVEQFTMEEIVRASKRIKNKKTPGSDNIPPEIVKLNAKMHGEYVTKIMNSILRSGEFSEIWKVAQLVLLEKTKKAGSSAVEYRPICLLDAAGKLLEQLLVERLKDELKQKGELSDRQYGFREKRLTVDAIRRVDDLARMEMSKTARTRQFCALITLDIKNAFNTANWNIIKGKLKKRNISEYMRKIIGSYLKDRWLQIDEEARIPVTCGVPQESVLGPILWNLLYDEVLTLELPDGVETLAFADDLAAVVKAKTENGIKPRKRSR